MKKFKLFIIPFVFFTIIQLSNFISAQSSYYCFFVANYSEETFSSIRIRQNGTTSFGQDLLPDMLVESYEHYWIRTGLVNSTIYDVEITELDGTPLKFKWTGKDGYVYTKPYITLDIAPLNTLMISNDDEGNITWDITNEDDYGFGDPCDQE